MKSLLDLCGKFTSRYIIDNGVLKEMTTEWQFKCREYPICHPNARLYGKVYPSSHVLLRLPSLEGTYTLLSNRDTTGVMELAVIMKRYRNTTFGAGVYVVCTFRLWRYNEFVSIVTGMVNVA